MARKYHSVGGKYGQDHDQGSQTTSTQQPKSQKTSSKPRKGPPKPIIATKSKDTTNRQDPNSRYYGPKSRKYDKAGKVRFDQAGSDGHGDGGPAKNPAEMGIIPSRKEISMVTMNTSGKSVMGLTPKYKINIMEEFLRTCPDAIFFQDAIGLSDLTLLMEDVSEGKYEYFFQHMNFEDDEQESMSPVRSLTGIAWNREKYFGTPLQLDDERLLTYRQWLKVHDLTIVKLDSRAQIGLEDVYPSFIAISWHGTDYDTPLRQRMKECEEFFSFLTVLRENNGQMPILIGGDFNMDMKSFDIAVYRHFILVPYRPVSGSLAKDLKNTFVFTMDSLQVTETGFKQHHPEIFASPFITAKLRGRNKIRLWAVVRIQRAFKQMKKHQGERVEARRKFDENKRRWRKKIDGEDYASDAEAPERSHGRQPERNGEPKSQRQAEGGPKTKDRRYALYWDEQDDPRYNPEEDQRPMEERRRRDFTEGKPNVINDIYQKSPSHVTGYRRQRFNDLKSVQDRRQEEDANQMLYRPNY